MKVGDRVVVILNARHRGVLWHVDPPAIGETQPVCLVKRDDLPKSFAPIPYDASELCLEPGS